MKPKVNTKCVASHYAGSNERIVEFSVNGNGGLISFVAREDGSLVVQLYRMDKNIDVTVSYDAGWAIAEPTRDGKGLYIKNK
jgi:hypothetical protein